MSWKDLFYDEYIFIYHAEHQENTFGKQNY